MSRHPSTNPRDATPSVLRFQPDRLAFTHAGPGRFLHDDYRDLHLFVVWEPARHLQEEILTELGSVFRILHVSEVLWREEIAETAFARLYKTPDSLRVGLPDKVGTGGAFLVVVVEDLEPCYGFHLGPTSLKLANLTVVGLKDRLREAVGGFLVHSSRTRREFFEQAPLLLGLARLRSILEGTPWDGRVERIREDPPGSEGWRDLPELFEFLTTTSNWLLLRGVDDLTRVPPDHPGFYLDAQCDELDAFLAAANAASPAVSSRRHKCRVSVAGVQVPLDVRSVGDGYFDARWQADMLRHRVMSSDGVPHPNADDHFFSLLYRAWLHKPSIDEDRLRQLADLASAIGLEDVSADALRSDEQAVKLLGGFLRITGYCVTRPSDRGITIDRSMVRRLGSVTDRREGTWLGRGLAETYRRLPAESRAVIPKQAKRRLKRLLRPAGRR